MVIQVLVQTSHQRLTTRTLKNLFCFAIFKRYLSSRYFSMYRAGSVFPLIGIKACLYTVGENIWSAKENETKVASSL